MVQIAIPYAYGCTVRVYAYGMYHTRTVRNTRTVSNIPSDTATAKYEGNFVRLLGHSMQLVVWFLVHRPHAIPATDFWHYTCAMTSFNWFYHFLHIGMHWQLLSLCLQF